MFLPLHPSPCGTRIRTVNESTVEGTRSAVDCVGQVDYEDKVLIEAEYPSVVSRAGALLPQHGIELAWVQRRPLIEKILTKASTLLSSDIAQLSNLYV